MFAPRVLAMAPNNANNSELPSNLLLKKVSPKVLLPCLTVVWGIITMCLGFVRGFTSFWVVRALLGVAEGGLLPGMVLYLSSLYTRGELALRIGIFYSAASLSGAFGGLCSGGGPCGIVVHHLLTIHVRRSACAWIVSNRTAGWP